MLGNVGTANAQQVLDHVDPARIQSTLPTASLAPPPPPPAAAPRPSIVVQSGAVTVGAISLSGLRALHAADFADIFAIYVGRTLSPGALAGLADAVADRARARGYLFVAVTIPPQQLQSGVLRLVIDEGRVDQVRLIGPRNRAVEAALKPLVGIGPITVDQLQRHILIAADVPGVVLGRARLLREGDRDVLAIEIGQRKITGVASIDDFGSRPIGPIRATATVNVNQVFADDDTVTFTAATTPAQPQELAYGAARYLKRVGSDGTEVSLGVSYAAVHPGSYLTDRQIDGRSWEVEAAASRPLLRRRATSLWIEARLDINSFKQNWSGSLARRDRLTVLRARLFGYQALLGGTLQTSVMISEGLGLFDATQAGDALASRPDADGRFTTIAFAANWTGKITGPINARLSLVDQFATRPLLISEEIGLGGGQFLRPYDYNERSGDRGLVGSAELSAQIAKRVGLLADPTIYAFVSGGSVANLADGDGGGSLFAAGGGFRTAIGRSLTADAGIAYPLSGPRYDSGTASPVVNLQLVRRF